MIHCVKPEPKSTAQNCHSIFSSSKQSSVSPCH